MPTSLTFPERIEEELEDARIKFPGQEDTVTQAEWLSILVEEVGEVARALNDDESITRVCDELVQVGAMAYRMYVSMMGK